MNHDNELAVPLQKCCNESVEDAPSQSAFCGEHKVQRPLLQARTCLCTLSASAGRTLPHAVAVMPPHLTELQRLVFASCRTNDSQLCASMYQTDQEKVRCNGCHAAHPYQARQARRRIRSEFQSVTTCCHLQEEWHLPWHCDQQQDEIFVIVRVIANRMVRTWTPPRVISGRSGGAEVVCKLSSVGT